MKTIATIAATLLLSFSLQAANPEIALKQPNKARKSSLMNAFSERQSTRSFDQKDLSLADLSDLLWAANGMNRPKDEKRTAPTARNRQEVEVYVIMKDGAYLYNAKEHKLVLVNEGNHFDAVAGSQDFVKAAPLALVIVSDIAKLGDPTQDQTKMMAGVDVGIVSQNISLFCAGAGLATVPRGFMDKDALKVALKLSDSQLPIINHPVGYLKK